MSSTKFLAQSRVRDAIHSLDLIIQRLQPITESQLASDQILIDACCYRICVIGEAIDYAKTYEPAVFASTSVTNTTWNDLVNVRNHFIHQYNYASAKAVWMFFKNAQGIKLGLANVLGKL